MKRIIVMIGLTLLLALCLVSCGPDARETKYNDALAMIESGNYTEAYAAFKELGDYKDSQKHLDRFAYFPTTITYDFHDRAGVMTTTLGKFNLPATTVSEADIGKKEGTYTYDDKGNLLKQIMTSDGVTAYFEFTYDENNHRIKAENYENDVLVTVHDFTYNALGLLEKETFSSEGVVVYESVNTYDEKGNLIRTDYTSETRGNYVYSYTYDEKGNLTSEKCDAPDGSVNYFNYTYTHDENGNLISGVYSRDDNSYTGRFEYDAEGRRTKDEYTNSDGRKEVYTKEYNADGLLVREVWNYADGDVETADYEYTLTYITIDVPAETESWLDGLFDIN